KTELPDRRFDSLKQVAANLKSIVNANSRGEPALVGRTKNRAALVQDAGCVLRRQCEVLHRVVKTLISFKESDALVAQSPTRLRRAANHRVEARAIAAASENSDSFLVHGDASVEIRVENTYAMEI